MTYNYHTHTFRCHHAEGTEREYVERAIAGGIKKMGFSEHVPQEFPEGYRSYWRMFSEDVADYFETLRSLREEYRGRIEIFIGFEMEYYPRYFDEMRRNALAWGAEYLILGEHYLNSEYPLGKYAAFENGSEEDLASYADDVAAGIGTGLFSCVAHPDLFNFKGDPAVYEREMTKICKASLEADVPLEINLLGLRRGRHYPNPEFWRIAGKLGCRAVVGCDAHSPDDAYDAVSEGAALRMAESFGVEVESDPALILLS